MNPYISYILDANILIEAHRRYYAFDILPRFWDELIRLSKNGDVGSIKPVYDEIVEGNDALSKWAKANKDFFRDINEDTFDEYRKIMKWLQQTQYNESAKNSFMSGADGWVIAYAMAVNGIVVTHEAARNKDIKRKVPIPNVCYEFGIDCIDTFDMLRRLKVQF